MILQKLFQPIVENMTIHPSGPTICSFKRASTHWEIGLQLFLIFSTSIDLYSMIKNIHIYVLNGCKQ